MSVATDIVANVEPGRPDLGEATLYFSVSEGLAARVMFTEAPSEDAPFVANQFCPMDTPVAATHANITARYENSSDTYVTLTATDNGDGTITVTAPKNTFEAGSYPVILETDLTYSGETVSRRVEFTITVSESALGVEMIQAELSFSSRSEFVTWAAATTASDGAIASDGTVLYKATSGATDFADLSGWVPYLTVQPDHWIDVVDDTVDCGEALQSALTYVDSQGGGEVLLGDKTYRVTNTNAGLVVGSNTTIRGTGPSSIIAFDDDDSDTRNDLFRVTDGDTHENITFRDFAIVGNADGDLDERSHFFTLQKITNLRIINMTMTGSRFMGVTTLECDDIEVSGCRLTKFYRDGLHLKNSRNVRVTNNYFRYIGDDAIALSLRTAVYLDLTEEDPGRDNLLISGNQIEDSNGILVLGAKNAIITNNTMNRCTFRAMYLGYSASFESGDTTPHGLIVTGNIINDMLPVSLFGETSNVATGLRITHYGPVGTDGVPGQPDSSNLIVKPYDGFYDVNTNDGASTAPGPHSILISGNKFRRTLPAVAAYSDWGRGTPWHKGETLDPAVTEAILDGTNQDATSIQITGSARNFQIIDNEFSGVADPVHLRTPATNTPTPWENGLIARNIFEDFGGSGTGTRVDPFYGLRIIGGTNAVKVVDNIFDGDPYHRAADRNSDGSWANGTVSVHCISLNSDSGTFGDQEGNIVISGNSFQNALVVFSPFEDYEQLVGVNELICEPTGSNYQATNKGIGTVPSGPSWRVVVADCDPTSATFGQTITAPPSTSAAMPTTGTFFAQTFVEKLTKVPEGTAADRYIIWGWIRITTGSNHVLGTDWREVVFRTEI